MEVAVNHRLQITQKVKEAMLLSCNDVLNFTDEPSRKLNAEYLFTVNVAKAINELNGPPGDPYKIFIERHTKSFARDCLPPVVLSGGALRSRKTVFRKGIPKINRNGRIDICVYFDQPNNGYFGEQPLCAIELKGFNPPRTLVLEDLKRNLEYHRLSGGTGDSVLDFSLFAALHSTEKSSDEKQAVDNVEKIKNLYSKWVCELGSLSDITLEIETFTVRKELVGRVLDEADYQVLDTDARHHFIGVIVTTQPKAQAQLR